MSLVRFRFWALYMREWLSGRASPCQGEGREFESRLALFILGEGKKEASNISCASFFVPMICLYEILIENKNSWNLFCLKDPSYFFMRITF